MTGAISDHLRYDVLQPVLRKGLDAREGGVRDTSLRIFCIVSDVRRYKDAALPSGIKILTAMRRTARRVYRETANANVRTAGWVASH